MNLLKITCLSISILAPPGSTKMNIKDDHLYHGAALTQIPDHEWSASITEGQQVAINMLDPDYYDRSLLHCH